MTKRCHSPAIFKPSEMTPKNLIGRCRVKSFLICIGFNFFQLLSAVSPKTVVYVRMDCLPLKCMGYRISHRSLWCHGFAPSGSRLLFTNVTVLCICVCVCVYVCMSGYEWVYVCVYLCVCVYVTVWVYVYVCVCAYIL